MKAPREARVDLIRGLCLLLIFVGHAQFSFSAFVQNGRGFSDASEIFVLLAGFSCAMAYGRIGADGRAGEARAGGSWRRAGTIYAVHIGLVAGLMGLAAAGASIFGREAALSTLRIPPEASLGLDFVRALMLAFMPGELDILPLYVVLLLGFPLAAALHRRSARLLLGASLALWFVAGALRLNLPNAAAAEGHWYFSPLSWQFVFAIGLVLGWRAKRGLDPLPFRRPLLLAALAFAVAAVPAGLALHFAVLGPDLAQGAIVRALAGKTHAGPLRLLNAMAILYVLWHWPLFSRWVRSATAGPILAAGRNSLPVFALGLVLSTGLAAIPALGIAVPLPVQVGLCLAGIAAQLAFGVWRQGRRTVRAAATPLMKVMPRSAHTSRLDADRASSDVR